MQYIPCNSALLAQETLFLTQKGTFFAFWLDQAGQGGEAATGCLCDLAAVFLVPIGCMIFSLL